MPMCRKEGRRKSPAFKICFLKPQSLVVDKISCVFEFRGVAVVPRND
jgi:hypothetical protein